MKITTLGTSHGAAERDRFCSSILIEIKDSLYLIDCGAPASALIERKGLSTKDLKAVFLTHMHEDHCGTLSAIYKKFTVYHPDKKVIVYFPEEAGIEGFKAWVGALHMKSEQTSFEFGLTLEGEIYRDDNIIVSACRTYHLGEQFPSYSYTIEAEGKRIVFTGDMGADFWDFPKSATEKHCDLVISEFTHFRPVNIREAVSNIAKADADRIIFSHVQNNKSEAVLDYAELFSCPISIASDGDEYVL